MLALTRQKDRGLLLGRSAAAVLALLAVGGLTVVGLTAISIRPYTAASGLGNQTTLLGNELSLLIFLGLLAIAIALFALTLNGRKRAGASIAASLAVTVGMMGVGSLSAAALGLQGEDGGFLDTLLALILFPTIGIGLFSAAKRELESLSPRRAGPLLDHNLSAATGICLGLVALCSFLVFSLTGREGEELRHLNDTRDFDDALMATQVSLNALEEHLKHASVSDSSLDPDAASFKLDIEQAKNSLRRLGPFASWPGHQDRLAATIARTTSALADFNAAVGPPSGDRSRADALASAVNKMSDASAELTQEISRSSHALQTQLDAHVFEHTRRRRGAAIVLSAAAAAIVVTLGAIHLLFQRDSVARQRSEAVLRRHNETLKGFAHTVAHDLRAPLRGIAGYAAELDSQAHLVDSRGRYCISQINTAAQNLERLIGDTLDYAQLDAETPSLSTIMLPALVASLLQQRAPEIRQHGTVVDTHFGVVTVRSWERGVAQIVGNLLDNAIKYSRNAHPPRLRIETAQTPLSWRLAIYDNGVGFDMKYHDRIFGLFQRLVTTDEFEGTGAGLAIVRKITDRLGGTVQAEGRPGGGATFLVELPRIVNPELT